MKFSIPPRAARGRSRWLAMGLGAALLAGAAIAADPPFFSGPSMAKPASPALFAGKGFAPNASVTLMVRDPSGSTAGYSAVISPEGVFSYQLLPSQAGVYTLTVTDSGGRQLASATVSVRP
jgi:hypothetical protein